MILLAFGSLLIASAFIVVGWFRQGWRHRLPVSIYNAGLCMALGMDLTAMGFVLMLGGRVQQILLDRSDFGTESPFYWLGIGMLFAGKTFFVWLAALGEGRSYSKSYLFAYWSALAAWAAFCVWWYV